jgi:branched-chain amino acid aminotransferase
MVSMWLNWAYTFLSARRWSVALDLGAQFFAAHNLVLDGLANALRGYGASGMVPFDSPIEVYLPCWPWGAYLGEEGRTRGIRVKTSSFNRHHINVTLTQAKATSNYTNSIHACMEATMDGYDEALMLNTSGYVCEGSTENLFILKDGVAYTPDSSCGALRGITRDSIMHICRDLKLDVVEKQITRDEVYTADEAFFTGTAAEVIPIRELDRIEIGTGSHAGTRGTMTKTIQDAYADIVRGRNEQYCHWLSYV